jgi:hypothetical protein
MYQRGSTKRFSLIFFMNPSSPNFDYDDDGYFLPNLEYEYDYEPTVVKGAYTFEKSPPIPMTSLMKGNVVNDPPTIPRKYIPRRQQQPRPALGNLAQPEYPTQYELRITNYAVPEPLPTQYRNQTRRPSEDKLLANHFPSYRSAGSMQPINSLYSQKYEDFESGRSQSVKSSQSLLRKRKSTRIGAPRYCCGCFSTRKMCVMVMGGLIFVIVISGVIAFLLFPRSPIITGGTPISTISSIQLPNNPVAALLQASRANPFQVSFQMGIALDLKPSSMVSHSYDELWVTAQLLDPDGSGRLIQGKLGSGELTRIRVPASSTTKLEVPFELQFELERPITAITDNSQVLAFIRSCQASRFPGLPPSRNPGQLGLRIEGGVVNKFTDWSGIQQKYQRDFTFPCPPSALEFATVIQQSIEQSRRS